MPAKPRPSRRAGAGRQTAAPLRALLATLALLALPAFAARAKLAAPPATSEVAEKQSDLKELRGRIEALRKDLASAEGSRADAADQLKDSERAISTLQRELHDLAGERGDLQATQKSLERQSRELESRLAAQQGQLEQLIYHQYLQGTPDSLRLLLNGDNPNQLARDLRYIAAVARARGQMLHEIEALLQEKQALADDTREQAGELAAVEAKQKEQHDKLLAQREQRKSLLARISAQISGQRKEIGALQRNEKNLSQLIERLAKIIAARPVPKKEAPRRVDKLLKEPAAPATEMAVERTPEAVPGGRFAGLKGSLRLPAKGTVTNRYGAARQEGSTWKGLFIRSSAGSEVRAIAGGRVVFAEWMRGFGNLLIVDHGDAYLSIYGNNDALLKQVGDVVKGGDKVASVGNSGGNPESGLYFELRHQGQPLDPLKWVSLK